MAFTPPSEDNENIFKTSRSTNLAIINTFMINGRNYHMYARTVTTTVEIRGLTKEEALNYAESAEYNYDARVGTMFTSSGGAWMRADRCEGAECHADAKRINDADMWRVVVRYSNTTVTHSELGWKKINT